jgi:UDP-glucose 4-epimerase
LRALASDTPQLLIVNLGTGQGVSVLEMLNTFTRVNGVQIPHQFVPRRAGDVAQCLADPQLANQVLSWQTELSLESMCRDAWRWQEMNPQGFDTPL